MQQRMSAISVKWVCVEAREVEIMDFLVRSLSSSSA